MSWSALVLVGCEQDLSIADTDKGLPGGDTDPVVDTDVTPDPQDDAEGPALEGPVLDVNPRFVDYGFLPEGETASADVTLRNIGTADLEIASLQLAGSGAFATDAAAALTIPPGGQEVVTIGFVSTRTEERGELRFRSNDPGLGVIQVGLTGSGAARLVEGDALDFGWVLVGDTAVVPWQLRNPGGAPVEVTDVSTTDPAFDVRVLNPVTIPAGGSATVDVAFTPLDYVPYAGELEIHSDAHDPPARPAVTGHGAGRPTATCSADPTPVTAIHEQFWFRGTGRDPAGRQIVEARWRMVSKPAGSRVTMPGTVIDIDRGPITPDLVGDYVGELVVVNDLGFESAPCQTTATAQSNTDLWVEMYWQYDEDIDLHLIRNNGSRNTNADCYYANCIGGLSWFTASRADDPYLDLDDTRRTGPENINIASPASATYKVVIHDHPFTSYQGANQVTVKIYLFGSLAWTGTHTFRGEDDWKDMAEIDWTRATPTVTPL